MPRGRDHPDVDASAISGYLVELAASFRKECIMSFSIREVSFYPIPTVLKANVLPYYVARYEATKVSEVGPIRGLPSPPLSVGNDGCTLGGSRSKVHRVAVQLEQSLCSSSVHPKHYGSNYVHLCIIHGEGMWSAKNRRQLKIMSIIGRAGQVPS